VGNLEELHQKEWKFHRKSHQRDARRAGNSTVQFVRDELPKSVAGFFSFLETSSRARTRSIIVLSSPPEDTILIRLTEFQKVRSRAEVVHVKTKGWPIPSPQIGFSCKELATHVKHRTVRSDRRDQPRRHVRVPSQPELKSDLRINRVHLPLNGQRNNLLTFENEQNCLSFHEDFINWMIHDT
jgi:hypothetical protein